MMFAIRSLPNRGLGMIATRDIPLGTRILQEPPLFETPARTLDVDQCRKHLVEAVKSLDKNKQREFFSLQSAYSGDPVVNITKTNGIPLDEDEERAAVFLKASRINHSCLPNAVHSYNENLKQLVIHAIRDIDAGDEITITYIWWTWSFTVRQARLLSYFGFTCTCNLCSLPSGQRQESDQRMRTINALDNELNNKDELLNRPLTSLRKAKKIVDLLQEQDLSGPHVGRTYKDAFFIVVMHSDAARASVFGQRSVKCQIECYGHDDPGALNMEALVKDPTTSEFYGRTNKWVSTLESVPSTLNDQDFEDWLWRRND